MLNALLFSFLPGQWIYTFYEIAFEFLSFWQKPYKNEKDWNDWWDGPKIYIFFFKIAAFYGLVEKKNLPYCPLSDWWKDIYHMCAIITLGLYIFDPLLVGQKSFFKEVYSEISVIMYG